jgi:hypothetical protein
MMEHEHNWIVTRDEDGNAVFIECAICGKEVG